VATAFVTGGTGFLGKNLIQDLVARGDRVIAIHRSTSDTSELARMGAELVVCGLDDVDALARAMPDGVDVVCHVAGDISWWSRNAEPQRRTNVDGTIICDSSKAVRELGYRPRSLDAMVEDSVAWLREHGHLRPAVR
jgi:dihydroflavonol-4-reductase